MNFKEMRRSLILVVVATITATMAQQFAWAQLERQNSDPGSVSATDPAPRTKDDSDAKAQDPRMVQKNEKGKRMVTEFWRRAKAKKSRESK